MNIFRKICLQNTNFSVSEHSAYFSLKKTLVGCGQGVDPPSSFTDMSATTPQLGVFLRLPLL